MASRRMKIKAAALVLLAEEQKKSRRRSVWVKEWLLRREEFGAYENLLKELELTDRQQFKNFMRLSAVDFEYLLMLVGPYILKTDTNLRSAISPKEKLLVTLRFIAAGDSYKSLMYLFRISASCISLFIPQVCSKIYEVLKDKYLKLPHDEDSWLKISRGFEDKWNFPNCVGSLDGKHIVFQAPPLSGSYFFNYKNSHSVVLMALVDSNYKILYMDVGCNGRISDGGVFANCSLSKALENNTLSIPSPRALNGRINKSPYVVLADDAFPLKPYLMKPYPMKSISGSHRVFNYRLSRARRVVENFFGHIAQRFRILRKPLLLNPDKTINIVSAICALHNFLLVRDSVYNEDLGGESKGIAKERSREEEMPQTNMLTLQRGLANRSSERAKEVRECFREYFMSPEGEVAWQYKCI